MRPKSQIYLSLVIYFTEQIPHSTAEQSISPKAAPYHSASSMYAAFPIKNNAVSPLWTTKGFVSATTAAVNTRNPVPFIREDNAARENAPNNVSKRTTGFLLKTVTPSTEII